MWSTGAIYCRAVVVATHGFRQTDCMPDYVFDAELWEWPARAAWFFVSVPEAMSDEIDARTQGLTPFGSVRVTVTVGASTWSTSLFPDTTRGCYVLPIKKAVRVAEAIAPGDTARVQLDIADARP